MGSLIGAKKPKIDTSAAEAAAKAKREAEAKAAADEKIAASDEEYRRTKQRGKAGTIINVDDAPGRSLMGG